MNQYQANRPQRNDDRTNAITSIIEELVRIKKPLSQCLSAKDLYLPEGKAHQIAMTIVDLNISQLRKIFDYIDKAAALSNEGKFKQAQETLFMVVPMVAYAAGRQLIKPMNFNDFIQTVITPERIQGHEDIQALHKMMQSIIAYKKK